MAEKLRCSSCGEFKQRQAFHKNASTKTGRANQCKPCFRLCQAGLRTPEYVRDKQLRRDFGISLDEYNQMVAACDGLCHLCGRPPGKYSLAVDHCHDTGRIRGLLCTKCNTALGTLGDNEEGLLRALAYLCESCQ
jgi:hypothetical protein